MRKTIRLDKEDVRNIVAVTYGVDGSEVDIDCFFDMEGYGPAEHIVPNVRIHVDVTEKKRTEREIVKENLKKMIRFDERTIGTPCSTCAVSAKMALDMLIEDETYMAVMAGVFPDTENQPCPPPPKGAGS